MMKKFEDLVDACMEVKSRKVTIVGIPLRYNVSSYLQSKRIGLNRRLSALCEDSGVEFLSFEPERHWVLRDRLHLNARGEQELARKIFSHCKYFLV